MNQIPFASIMYKIQDKKFILYIGFESVLKSGPGSGPQ